MSENWRMDSDERNYLKDYFSDRKSIPYSKFQLDYPDAVNSKSWGREKPLYWSSYKRVLEQLEEDQWVLDVGCGINPLKYFHKKTYGIDITDVGSDEQVAIEDFESPKKFDVAVCWGSINFGHYQLIEKQIERHILTYLKVFYFFFIVTYSDNVKVSYIVLKIFFNNNC